MCSTASTPSRKNRREISGVAHVARDELRGSGGRWRGCLCFRLSMTTTVIAALNQQIDDVAANEARAARDQNRGRVIRACSPGR